jgi:acyl-coenzyme A synthetase/AMP-(fatty) acid ligase/acyl carrier protein
MNKLEGLFKAPVIEVYGMTEITPITINPLDSIKRKPGSAGLAVGLEISIMDENDNILPGGERGEIVIRGEHVIKRYENNDTANGKAFSRGWFMTGDLGHLDDEGYLFISGRLKEILNVGGQKISPREIEEILVEHPLVREAAAFGVPHKSLGETIAAAVVVHREGEVLEMEMLRFLADRLAPYKVPRQIIIVRGIPRGPMEKLQRSALAEEFSHFLKQEYMPPSTETETVVAEIWQEILGTERVGILDNLFALGGDSIHATRIVSRINDVFHLQLPLQRVFEAPTVAGLSDMVDTTRWLMTEIQPGADSGACNLEEGRI